MIKRVLIAAAMIVATPGFLFSQDIFWSFDNDAVTTTAIESQGTSGTAYLFGAEAFAFDAADLNITIGSPFVAALTGGAGIDDEFSVVGGTKFNSSEVTILSTRRARWFAVNATQNGVNPTLAPLFDPNFVPGVGHLLAEVNYDVVGEGDTSFGVSLGAQGVLYYPNTFLTPTFQSATLTGVAAPEPSSAFLLILGAVGLIARRRKA